MSVSDQSEFTQRAIKEFEFLVEDYLCALYKNPILGELIFTTGNTSIRIEREARSYMISLDLSLLDLDERYTLNAIADALKLENPLPSLFDVGDRKRMDQNLARLSIQLQQCLPLILARDKETMDLIARASSNARRAYTLEATYGPIRNAANLAWEQKDWQCALDMYTKAKPALTESELRRLLFLEDKLST